MLIEGEKKDEVAKLLKTKGAINYLGYENDFGYCVVTDKDNINETWIIKLGQTNYKLNVNDNGNKFKSYFQKYFFLKKNKNIAFDEFYTPEFFKELELDTKSGFSMGIDVVSGKKQKSFFKDLTNIHIAWGQGSWKSVDLYNLFYQLYQKEYSEFIIFDKGDLQGLAWLPKVIAAARIDDSWKSKENFFQFYNYLMFEYKKRRVIFDKAGVANYYAYMEKFYKGEVDTPMNQIFAFLDEFNSWRFEIWNVVGQGKFDQYFWNIINKLRASGVCLIAATQVLLRSKIGVVAHGGFKGGFYGVVADADTVTTQVLDNLLNRLKGTYLFYSTNDNTYLKMPFIPSSAFLYDKLKDLPLPKGYTNLKSESFSLLVNEYVKSNKESSVIMKDYVKNFTRIGMDDESIKQLERNFLFIPFSVLLYKVLSMHDKGVLDTSYNIFQNISFEQLSGGDKDPIDDSLQENIDVFCGKEEDKFIKEIIKSFQYSSGEIDDENGIDFVEQFWVLVKTSLIRRWLINNRIERNITVKKEDNASVLLEKKLNEKIESLDFLKPKRPEPAPMPVKEGLFAETTSEDEETNKIIEKPIQENNEVEESIEENNENLLPDEWGIENIEVVEENTQEINSQLENNSFDSFFADDTIVEGNIDNTMDEALSVFKK